MGSKKAERPKTIRGNTKTTRVDWLCAARNVLIKEGADRVKIDPLARSLNVTRGGFYWFFESRQDLLEQLLEEWVDPKNDPLIAAMTARTGSSMDRMIRFTMEIIDEKSYSPALDSAMRDWSRNSKDVREAVRTVDTRRMEYLTNLFDDLGCLPEDALIRARIFYFHQIGYYEIGFNESRKRRLHYLPIYFKHLTGFDLPVEELKT
jgi:AcrR family transcriptional regulator